MGMDVDKPSERPTHFFLLNYTDAGRFGMAGLPSVVSRIWLAWSLAERGDFVAATAHTAEAIAIAEAAHHPWSLAAAYFGAGMVNLLRGDLAIGRAVLTRGLVSMPQQAREHFTIAPAMYREMDMRFWPEQAETELKHLQ